MGQYYSKEINNFLTRGFVRTKEDLDPFTFAQDPTFLSFKLEFFPGDIVPRPGTFGETTVDKMLNDPFLIHNLSHDCLLRPPKFNIDGGFTIPTGSAILQAPEYKPMANPNEYSFADSAEDYLYAIGSVNRIGHLRAFKNLLYKLENEAPWFFQKILGTSSLYTIDPNVNTKKDGILTFECLETVDMRMSMLADFYRQAAFDFERHKEVLPYNLRTFRMKIHVFEMRNFNTSSGAIAGLIAGSNQKEFDNVIKSRAAGGGEAIKANFTRQERILASQFDAISMQTYELGLCEFDFYSQAPNYLEELSVVEIPEATSAFKIKFGTVRKSGKYSFYQYLTDYVVHRNLFPGSSSFSTIDVKSPLASPFYDAAVTDIGLNKYDSGNAPDLKTLSAKIASISESSISNLELKKAESEIDLENQTNSFGNRKHVRRPSGLGGLVLGAAESAIGSAIGNVQSKIQKVLLGNALDNIPSPAEASQAILGFINPGLGLTRGPGVDPQSSEDPGNVQFEPGIKDTNIVQSPFVPLSTSQTITGGGFDPLSNLGPINQSVLDPLPPLGALSPGGLDPLPPLGALSPGGLDPLPPLGALSPGGLDPLPPLGALSPGGLDPLSVDTDIELLRFSKNPQSMDISKLLTETLSTDNTLTQNPIESAPNQPVINPRNADFENTPVVTTLKNKSVGFETPPAQPQISPKNVFRF